MPTLHHQMFHISLVLRCFRKCAKMRTFESERVILEKMTVATRSNISPQFNPFTCVPAMERANDVTRSFLDLRLPPALPATWLPPWQRHSPQVSWQPIQISVFLQIEAARPIYGYLQSPDFTRVIASPS